MQSTLVEANFLLTCQADFRQNQVPRVTTDLVCQFHKSVQDE